MKRLEGEWFTLMGMREFSRNGERMPTYSESPHPNDNGDHMIFEVKLQAHDENNMWAFVAIDV